MENQTTSQGVEQQGQGPEKKSPIQVNQLLDQLKNSSKIEKVLLGALLALLITAFLPWVKIEVFYTQSFSGWNFSGWVQLFSLVSLAAIILFFFKKKIALLTALGVGAASIIFQVYTLIRMSGQGTDMGALGDIMGGFGGANVAVGFYLYFAAAIVMVVTSVMILKGKK